MILQKLFWHGKQLFKKPEVKLDCLTDIERILMVTKGIRGGIYHSICQYAKVNNKNMKDYDINK